MRHALAHPDETVAKPELYNRALSKRAAQESIVVLGRILLDFSVDDKLHSSVLFLEDRST